RPGGHVRLKDGYYITQPDIEKKPRASGADIHYYRGDVNMAHFLREADAKSILPHIEEARRIYSAAKAARKDLNELSRYLNDNLPGMFSVNEFVSLFKSGGPFKLDVPFFVRPTGSTVNDVENLSTRFANLRMGSDDVHSVAMQRSDPSY